MQPEARKYISCRKIKMAHKVSTGVVITLGIYFCSLVLFDNGSAQMVGGLTAEQPANRKIRQMVFSLRPEIMANFVGVTDGTTNNEIPYRSESSIVPISYKTQVVNGINYFIKIRVPMGEESKYYNILVFSDFRGKNVRLVRVQGPVSVENEIGFF